MSEEWFESLVVPYPEVVEVDVLEYVRSRPLARSALKELEYGYSRLSLSKDEDKEVPGLQNLALVSDHGEVTNLGRFVASQV
jgi:hypothetical protein